MRKAIVETVTGLVVNVIEIEPNADWTPPDGCDVLDAGDAGPGWLWDGQRLSPPEPVIPSRIYVLMRLSTFTFTDDGTKVLRPEVELVRERAQLLGLLHEKLQINPTSLPLEEIQKMLQLERGV